MALVLGNELRAGLIPIYPELSGRVGGRLLRFFIAPFPSFRSGSGIRVRMTTCVFVILNEA